MSQDIENIHLNAMKQVKKNMSANIIFPMPGTEQVNETANITSYLHLNGLE